MIPVLAWLRVALAVLLLAAGPVSAQDGARTLELERWESTAVRAENALESGQASEMALESLRAEIARYRESFQKAQSEQSQRIATLQAQIDTLGPVPEGDAVEAPDIAARRAELNDQMTRQRAPVLAAEEAYTRADGLIREIDKTIRTRQTAEIFSRGPVPVDPTYWPGAVEALGSTLRLVWTETFTAWNSEQRRTLLLDSLPSVLVLVLIALVLMHRGPVWAERGVIALRRMTRRGTGVWKFLLSLGQMILPLIGVVALAAALRQTGLVGTRGDDLLETLPGYICVLVYIRWLAGQTFSRDDHVATLPISRKRRTEARYYFSILAVLVLLRLLMLNLIAYVDPTVEVLSVLELPFIAVCALVLFRLGQVLEAARLGNETEGPADHEQDGMHFRLRIARGVGRAVIMVALISPVAAVLGYKTLAVSLLFPTITTLLLIGTVMVLQRLVSDLYELVSGVAVSDAQSLIPTLAGFALILGSLPLLVLIWGARVADLTELWAMFREGYVVGDTRIAPTDFLNFVLVFLFGYLITRLLQGGLRSSILPKTRIDLGGQNAMVAGVGYVGLTLAGLAAVSAAGLDLSSLALVAGALSLGIGFGLRTIVENFVSGIILLIERPITEGDWIEVGDEMGYVRGISVRATRIETFDRTDVIVPNADLITGRVTNYTRGNSLGRVIVKASAAYGSNTRHVSDVLLGIAREHPEVLMNPEPYVYFKGFGSNGLDFEIRAILINVNNILDVQTEMNHQISERFAAEGIDIPFPQRDIWLRNPEVLDSVRRSAQLSAAPESDAATLHKSHSGTGPDLAPDGAPDASADAAPDSNADGAQDSDAGDASR
ncbi:DUF3772 domain-containing protein [Puniceibacterium sp. IMCC21224]|uniref:DUF3772 domain-containing protein n=1 Tax=Puniceibacterium sp. IMCC21224 TaxID=1618204 RepID=UPI00065D083D|nr:DUF3772 domain-containing protein [Puniceibacterium sp. IMCC21224]KMK67538.1 small-conductance mechanosensitive channel [Puniceibacterium sp. IMCC21224]